MMTRRRCSHFASAKVRLFRKLAKGCKRFFKKNAKKECRMDNKQTGEGGDTLLYNIYRAGRTHPGPPWEGGRGKRGTESGRSFYERRKAGRENEMPRNAKTRIWRVRFCPPEHMNMLSERTRTSHPGGQGRVTQEDRDESPRRTK